jgi:palmitoyl transferase
MHLKLNLTQSSIFKPQRHLVAFIFLIFTFTTFGTAFAEDQASSGAWTRAQNSLSQTWQSENVELYVPINTWHNRNYYRSEKIDEFNERPWGLGVGKYRFDDDGDWNAFYAMAFQDSHRHIEPVIGFGFQKMWHPTENTRLGAGYTVGLTMREDMHYIPLLGILPLVSVEYKQIALQSTYVPGGDGNGNILFTWLRWQIQ